MVSQLSDQELQLLRDSPTLQKAQRESEERRLAERKDWAGEIEVLTAAHVKEIPGLDDTLGARAARVEEAEEALKDAVEAHRVAYVYRSNATSRFDTQRGQLEAQLLADSAPPRLCAWAGPVSTGARCAQRVCVRPSLTNCRCLPAISRLTSRDRHDGVASQIRNRP